VDGVFVCPSIISQPASQSVWPSACPPPNMHRASISVCVILPAFSHNHDAVLPVKLLDLSVCATVSVARHKSTVHSQSRRGAFPVQSSNLPNVAVRVCPAMHCRCLSPCNWVFWHGFQAEMSAHLKHDLGVSQLVTTGWVGLSIHPSICLSVCLHPFVLLPNGRQGVGCDKGVSHLLCFCQTGSCAGPPSKAKRVGYRAK
jgi:hypothetical protein